MPFDIYGNNLRSGHCEVHPHVHEEYPCTLCYLEQERHQMQKEKEPVELHPDDPLNSCQAIAEPLQYVGTYGAGHGLEGMKEWGRVVTWCRESVATMEEQKERLKQYGCTLASIYSLVKPLAETNGVHGAIAECIETYAPLAAERQIKS